MQDRGRWWIRYENPRMEGEWVQWPVSLAGLGMLVRFLRHRRGRHAS